MSTLRDLKIKTNVVKRCIFEYRSTDLDSSLLDLMDRISKELTHYQKELEKQQERIEKLIANGADDHDIRKQVFSIDHFCL